MSSRIKAVDEGYGPRPLTPEGLRFVTADRCRHPNSAMSPEGASPQGDAHPHPPPLDTPVGSTVLHDGGGGGREAELMIGGGLCVEPVEVEGFAVGDSVKHRIISAR